MKKILAFLLVLVMALTSMVGCDVINGLLNGTEEGPTLEEAKTYLFSTYKDAAKAPAVDYDLVGKVIISGTSFAVTWSVDLDTITIKESTKANFWTVDLPEINATEVAYVLTATIADADGNKVEVKFNKTLPVIDSTGITSTPVEGVAYKLYMVQVNLNQKLFATSTDEQEHKYIQTTTDASKAADFYVEQVDGGYKWYTTINGVKNYVYAQGVDNNGKVSKYIGFSTENATVFNHVAETNSWQTTINGIKYCVGTYNTYKTICISEASYITAENTGVSQFVVEFMTSSYAETLKPDAELETIDDSAKVLDMIYALASGESKTANFVVTGVISEFDSYNNPVIIINGQTDKPVLCYKLTDEKFVVGATITVAAKMIKNYNGTYELMDCTLKNFTAGGGNTDANYEVVTELKNGDVVVIGAPAYNMALSATKVATYYNAGVSYASGFGAITDAELFVVTVNADGSYTFTSKTGDVIALADNYASLNVEGANKSWTLEAKEGTTGVYYVKNTVRGNYLEWYAEKDNWSTFATSSLSDLFEISFYKAGEGSGETPTPNPTPNPETPAEVTVTEAAGLADGTAVVITATVVKITYDWSDDAGNMSVDISDGTTTINAYKLASKVGLGDVIKITGNIGSFSGKKQIAEGATAEVVTAHTEHTYSDATCTAAATCTGCGAKNGASLGHNYVDGSCSRCGGAKPAAGTKYVFDMGANGTASHADGSDAGSSFTITCAEGEVIDFSAVSKVYTGARDATGNSCLKLGSSKAAGTMTFTVGANIDSVIIYVSGYKANDAKITINGGDVQTISVHSADGEYTAITIDTSVNKTVTFATADGGYRAMINTIELVCG